ncbi:alpha/beta fold hydrolase [Parvibaculum sp. MBR-TMA-1.3b-4.2]|jgi:pimeloyl-ACP methyl ester carboxylesterase
MNGVVTAPAPVGERKSWCDRDGEISFIEWAGESNADCPTLHFAHANGFNGLTYRQLLSPLAKDFRIRAWDARGHGLTSLPADPANLRNWYVYRDDLIRFIEGWAEETGGPIMLAGHSMGGALSVMAAAERPDLVRGLLLIDPVLIPNHQRRLIGLAQKLGIGGSNGFALARGAEKRRAEFPDAETVLRAYTGRGAFRSWPQEVIADYIEGGTVARADGTLELACKPAWEAASFRAQGHDSISPIAQLKAPFTLIYAGPGSTCRAPAPALLAAHDPQATILRIGRASHFIPMEFPETIRREMLDLQARIAAG